MVWKEKVSVLMLVVGVGVRYDDDDDGGFDRKRERCGFEMRHTYVLVIS